MATLNITMDCIYSKHKGKIMLQTILGCVGVFFGIILICLTDVEMKFRRQRELFRANLVLKWMKISGLISMLCIFIAIFLGE